MNDQEQPKPEDQPIIPKPNIESRLDDLPPEPLKALEELVKAGYGGQKIKNELEKRFGEITGLIPAARSTYEHFIEKHYDRLEKEKDIETQVLDSIKESTAALHESNQEVQKGNLSSAREKLADFGTFLKSRMELLESLQAKGNLSAQLEGVLLNYYNSYKSFLQVTVEFEKESESDKPNVFIRFVDRLRAELVDRIIDVHQKVHGEDKVIEFDTELETAINEVFDANTLEIHREADNDKDSKENNSKS